MWADFINNNVVPAAKRVLDMVLGEAQADQKSFSIALNEFKQTLGSIEEHLALRNFLVGHQMSLADALLVSILSTCFELVLDKKARDGQLKNLTRYTTLILKMAPCARVFGQVMFCKDVIQPNYNLEKPKEKAKDKAKAAAGADKNAQGQGKDKKNQKKDGEKKAEAAGK